MLSTMSRESLEHARQLSGRRYVSGSADGKHPHEESGEILLRFVLFRGGSVDKILCGTSFNDACKRHGFDPERLRQTCVVEQTR